MGDQDEIAGAGIIADFREDGVDLRLVRSRVAGRRIQRRKVLGVAEGEARGFARDAVAAGQHALDGRRPRREQGADLARLLLAAIGQVALRGAFLDVEIAGLADAAGAMALRISTTWPPSRSSAQPASVACAWPIRASRKTTETIRSMRAPWLGSRI